ncbi:hypothetical protein [Plantactinospora sp. WMMB782]|uniref:hypothetical protein n=1 Tax=Plantactinospora sp. WMMB782 TaxID=3404121 RepID=UPI003B94337F
MKQEIKDQWTAALRSGEFKQGASRLRTAEGYCCLGVLCEIAVKEGVIGPASQDEHGLYEYPDPHLSDNPEENDPDRTVHGVLPDAVVKWAGLGDFNPVIHGLTLADRNDNQGWTFDQLADLIEREL